MLRKNVDIRNITWDNTIVVKGETKDATNIKTNDKFIKEEWFFNH